MNVNIPKLNMPMKDNGVSKYNRNTVDAKSKTQEFNEVYERFRSNQGTNNNIADKRTTTNNNKKSESQPTKSLESNEKDVDLSEKEVQTPEELVLLLLKTYNQSSKINNNEEVQASDITTNEIKTTPDMQINTENTKDKNAILLLVKNLLAEDKLTPEIKGLLEQYVSISKSADEAKTSIKDFTILSGYTTEVSDLAVDNKTEIQNLKMQIIQQIQSMKNEKLEEQTEVAETQSEEAQIFNLEVEKPVIKEKLKVKNSVGVDPATKDELTAGDMKSSNNNQQLEVLKVSTVESTERVTTKGFPMDAKSEKEETFLKGILEEDGSKKGGKVSMLMNMLKTDKAADSIVQPKTDIVVHKNTFANDLIKAVKFMDTNTMKELRVSINPKDIGELMITVTMESGKLKANIEASSKDSYNLLMSNLEELKNSIKTNEIKIQDFNISLYNGDTTFFKDGSQKQGNEGQANYVGNNGQSNKSEEELVSDESSNSVIEGQIDILA